MEKNSGHLIAKDTCRDHSVFHCSISAPSTWRKEKEKENPCKWLIPLSKNLCAIHWSNEFCRTLALSSTPTEKKNEKMDFVQLYWILIKNCCTSCLFVGFHGRRNVSGKHTRVRGYCQFLRTFTRTEYEKVKKAKPSAERERIWFLRIWDLLIPTLPSYPLHLTKTTYMWKNTYWDWLEEKEHMVLVSVYTEWLQKTDIDYTANKARDLLLCNTETSSKLPQMTVKVMNYYEAIRIKARHTRFVNDTILIPRMSAKTRKDA